ncbi:hypothetical protein A5733_04280 [Mycobacterium sp. NS-7484]|uniref:hypothetical protein n=1 Tax=Mycobacterium sp. NS-7484 TaxID=1834161 RepID=UPI00096E4886|nr:hypothetical protein [Mycobacterium sp. NS-7484]OMC00334.1 hypothetical protein A5733_04280 [Mycobacterium sp. NS-7484]
MTWFRVDDSFYDHPKVLEAGTAAIGLWTLAGAYCARHLTDGVISDRQIRAIGGTRKQAAKLVEVGLWTCDEASANARRYFFNDWSEYQPSRADVTTRRRDDAERKRAARAAKADKQAKQENVRPDIQPDGARTSPDVSDDRPLYPTRPAPPHLKNYTTESCSSAKTPTPPAPPPAAVETLCARLRDRIVDNGSRRPTITERWRREARLLLDRDSRDLTKALNLIDWCQQDPFWRKNILSMPKFREKYDQLRLAALEDHQRRQGTPAGPSKRELTIAQIEARKTNPDPRLAALASFGRAPALDQPPTALPGAAS